jgi:hypothetical protein
MNQFSLNIKCTENRVICLEFNGNDVFIICPHGKINSIILIGITESEITGCPDISDTDMR